MLNSFKTASIILQGKLQDNFKQTSIYFEVLACGGVSTEQICCKPSCRSCLKASVIPPFLSMLCFPGFRHFATGKNLPIFRCVRDWHCQFDLTGPEHNVSAISQRLMLSGMLHSKPSLLSRFRPSSPPLACSSAPSFKTVIDRYHKMNNIARYNNLLTFNHR